MRKIEVEGREFQFQVGRSYVKVRGPNNFSRAPSIPEVIGGTLDSFERGQWKKTTAGMVTPADVRAYIEREYRL